MCSHIRLRIDKERKMDGKGLVASRLAAIRAQLPAGVNLVAVSKFHPVGALLEAYSVGQRVFGESRVQELMVKHDELPKDIEWHFIGSLQTNKVKYIAPFISLIHSVDSLKLMREIDRQAERNNRKIDVLLEVHIAQEETKHGMHPSALFELLERGEWKSLNHIRIRGLMTMASFVSNEVQIAHEFEQAEHLFSDVKKQFFSSDESFNLRSWGMSDDYPIALLHGANIIRVGTAIFGARE